MKKRYKKYLLPHLLYSFKKKKGSVKSGEKSKIYSTNDKDR